MGAVRGLSRLTTTVCACLVVTVFFVTLAMSASGVGRGLHYVTADQAREWTEGKVPLVLLDVRAEDEFAAGRLPGSINLPLATLPDGAEKVPRNRRLLIYCIHSSHRAPLAAAQLEKLGFDDVHVVQGGLVALIEAGFALESSAPSNPPRILPMTERCSDAEKAAQTSPR